MSAAPRGPASAGWAAGPAVSGLGRFLPRNLPRAAVRNEPRRRGLLGGASILPAISTMRRIAALGQVWLVLTSAALAAPPPPGSEDAALMAEFADWIRTQHSPAGGWCCDLSDGRPLFEGEWKVERGAYRILISRRHWPDAPEPGVWIDVPADRITAASPMGLPVAWWSATGPRLWCFAPVGGS